MPGINKIAVKPTGGKKMFATHSPFNGHLCTIANTQTCQGVSYKDLDLILCHSRVNELKYWMYWWPTRASCLKSFKKDHETYNFSEKLES